MAEPEWSNQSIVIMLQKKRLFYQLRLTMICTTILLVFVRVRVLSILDLSLLIKSGTTSLSRSRNISLYLRIERLLLFTGMTKKLLNLLDRSMTQDLVSERMIALNATLYTTKKPQWLMPKELPFIGRRPTNISSLFLP